MEKEAMSHGRAKKCDWAKVTDPDALEVMIKMGSICEGDEVKLTPLPSWRSIPGYVENRWMLVGTWTPAGGKVVASLGRAAQVTVNLWAVSTQVTAWRRKL